MGGGEFDDAEDYAVLGGGKGVSIGCVDGGGSGSAAMGKVGWKMGRWGVTYGYKDQRSTQNVSHSARIMRGRNVRGF